MEYVTLVKKAFMGITVNTCVLQTAKATIVRSPQESAMSVKLDIMVTYVIRIVLEAVTSMDVTNRVGDVWVA